MPRLTVFAACETAIVEDATKTISLINIISGLALAGSADQPLPPNVMVPKPWAIVTIWGRTPEDTGKIYEQRTVLVMPDGTEHFDTVAQFQMTHLAYSHRVNMLAFPVGQFGDWRIRLFLREAGIGAEWQPVAEYFLEVTLEDSPNPSGENP